VEEVLGRSILVAAECPSGCGEGAETGGDPASAERAIVLAVVLVQVEEWWVVPSETSLYLLRGLLCFDAETGAP